MSTSSSPGRSPRERVKHLAAALGVLGPLRQLRLRRALFAQGAELQIGFAISRFPSRTIRQLGYRWMGMALAPGARVHRGLQVRSARNITVGEGTVIGFDAILDGRRGIAIGRDVNISSEVAIWTLQHDHRDPAFGAVGAPVTVGDRAWLSFRATILPGVTIGEGAVVAAGAVVTHDVAPFTIVGGIPAKMIGTRSQQAVDYTLTRYPAPWFI